MRTLVPTLFFCLLSLRAYCQTNVSGNISSNTTWTKANSPYVLVGNVGVPAGFSLTIEPGTTITRTQNFNILINGILLADGVAEDSIRFTDNSSGQGSYFLDFQRSNLSTSSITYVAFEGYSSSRSNLLRIGNETEHNQAPQKNSGSLIIEHCRLHRGVFITRGYETGASVYIRNSRITNSYIWGLYPRTEPFFLEHCTISFSDLHSDSYNEGINISYSNVSETEMLLGCCGANFNIDYSNIINSSFSEHNNYNDITISNSKVINTPINITGSVTSTNSLFIGNITSLFASNALIKTQFVSLQNANFLLNGELDGVKIQTSETYSSSTITNCTFRNSRDAIVFTGSTTQCTVNSTNFINSQRYHFNNLSGRNHQIADSYFELTDEVAIREKIFDSGDDLARGTVTISNILLEPAYTSNSLNEIEVTKTVGENGEVVLDWTPYTGFATAGYFLYSGTYTGYSFSAKEDLGSTNTHVVMDGSIAEDFAITAYSAAADGADDQLDGNETWFSIAKIGSPIASPDAFVLDEDNVLNPDAAAGILANDIDTETMTVQLVQSVSQGTLSLQSDGSFTYTPAEDYHGIDAFIYKATDGTNFSGETTVTLTINAVNDAPVTTADGYQVDEDTNLTVSAVSGVLSNDVDTEGESIEALMVEEPIFGTVVLTADGSFTYEANGDYYGSDTFSYKAIDAAGNASEPELVTITVSPVNDTPTDITLSQSTVSENLSIGAFVGTLSTVDKDSEDTYSYQLVSGEGDADNSSFSLGGSALQTAASFDFELKSSYTIRVRSTDANGAVTEKVLAITVSNINDIIFNPTVADSWCHDDNSGMISLAAKQVVLPVTYSWDNASTSNVRQGLNPGSYQVRVTDATGAYKDTVINIVKRPTYEEQKLLFVSSDENGTRNKLVWNKEGGYNIDRYLIYREGDQSGIYEQIGFVFYGDASEYLDAESDSRVRPYRYRISVLDLCGDESILSDFHKTIHLTNNVGLNNSINLIWNQYQGIDYATVEVQKKENGGQWQLLEAISASNTSYTDVNFNPNVSNEYRVDVVLEEGVSSGRNTEEFTRISSNKLVIRAGSILSVPTADSDFSVFPNPATNFLSIQSPFNDFTIELSDLSGRVIQTMFNQERIAELDLRGLVKGIYIVRLTGSNKEKEKVYIRKIIKE